MNSLLAATIRALSLSLLGAASLVLVPQTVPGASGRAHAQEKGTLTKRVLPPLRNPDDPATPAKELFGRKDAPANIAARSIGSYARGCLAGGTSIAVDGDAWQVMRLSRNRNWGHPELIKVVERVARAGKQQGVWPGLLVGDLAQPRGGPMLTGHASHQIGLDADVWLTPMPARTLTRREREETSAINVVRADRKDIDPRIWTEGHLQIIRIAAQQPEVERIFVNAAIKKAICRYQGADRRWLSKVRPMWGHNYHFHIRIKCPAGNASCSPQGQPPEGEGCGSELNWWFSEAVLNPPKPKQPPRLRPQMTMSQLPSECRMVLNAN